MIGKCLTPALVPSLDKLADASAAQPKALRAKSFNAAVKYVGSFIELCLSVTFTRSFSVEYKIWKR